MTYFGSFDENKYSWIETFQDEEDSSDVELEEDHEVEFGLTDPEHNYEYEHCDRNPGHFNMPLVRNVRLEHLPEEWRYPDLFFDLMRVARCVVKVTAHYTSRNRPKGFPAHFQRGTWVENRGTGLLLFNSEFSKMPIIDCLVKDCQIPGPHKTTAIFKVLTSTSVVFDDVEADKTEVEFFLDSKEDEKKHVVTGQGIKVLRLSENDERCLLLCVSHDLHLFKKVQTLPPYVSLLDAALAPTPSQRPRDPLVITISHPHGHLKHVSFGTWADYLQDGIPQPDEPLKDVISMWEKPDPQKMENAYSRNGKYLSPQNMEELKRRSETEPDMLFSDFLQARSEGNNLDVMYKYIKPRTASCPGSSGAHVLICLPGQGETPWVYAGIRNIRRRKDSLGEKRAVEFGHQFQEDIAAALSK